MSVLASHQDAQPGNSSGIQRSEVKSATAFRTISEVATELDVPQHVLRFWESKFSQIRPMKRGGGRRYYRPEDVRLIKQIQDLLHNQGYTIKGVQKLFKESRGNGIINRISVPSSVVPATPEKNAAYDLAPQAGIKPTGLSLKKRQELEGLLDELKSLRELLKQSGL
jgi:DNA-binding transcriptional MerR regulator